MTISFFLQDNWVYVPIGGAPREVEEAFYKEFSYELQNKQFIPAVKAGKWDGVIRLYRSRRFPIGLLERAVDIANRHGNDVSISDMRKEKGGKLGLKYVGPPLRNYQEEALLKASMGNRTITAPTGSGKTLVAIALMAALDRRTLIIVNRKELLYQWKDEIRKNLRMFRDTPTDDAGFIEAALIGDGQREESSITIAMIQSLYQKLPKQAYDVVICDETHHTPAREWGKVMSSLPCKYRYGLSATPFREDGAELLIFAHTGPVLQMGDVEVLVEEGYIAGIELQVIQGAPDIEARYTPWVAEYQGTLDDTGRMERLSQKAVDLYQQGHRLYIDVRRIKHGERIVEDLSSHDVPAIFLQGKDTTKRRKEVLSKFEKGDKFVLVSTLIKEGVDLPTMSAIVLAGGGKSGTALIQVVGRALRPKKGTRAVIVDVEDHGKYMHKHFKRRMRVMRSYYGESLKMDFPDPNVNPDDPWSTAEKL